MKRPRKFHKSKALTIGARKNFLSRMHSAFSANTSLNGTFDTFFKITMNEKRFLVDFLEAYFPELKKFYKFSDVKILSSDIIDRAFSKRMADLIVLIPSVEEGRDDLTLTIVFEHKAQSGPKENRHTVVQVTNYIVSTTFRLLEELGLPPRQPIGVVIYNGDDLDYGDLFWEDHFKVPEQFADYQLKCRLLCINLTRAFKENNLPGSGILLSALRAMGGGGSGELDQKLQSVLEPLKAGNIESGRVQNFVKTLMFYYVRVLVSEGKFVTQDDVYRDFAGVTTEETRDEVKTFWEIRVEDGERRGERRGEQRGEQRGIMKGQISYIQRLLNKAYGSDAAALCDQVSKITDMTVLDKIFDLVYRPDSLEDTSREIDILLSANPHATDPLKFD